MSGFSESSLSTKLSELNQSAPSIQGVSLWLLHHRKHYQTSVRVWYKELGNTKKDRKLTMLYLANDVVQNARKKYPEIPKEFGKVMKQVFAHLGALDFDKKTDASLDRLLSIWKERQIFDKQVTLDIEKVWGARSKATSVLKDKPLRTPSSSPPRKKEKLSPPDSNNVTEKSLSELFTESSDKDHNANCNGNGSLSPSLPPDSEDLIAALQHLEASASSDANIREEIAKLPPELADVSSVEKLVSESEVRNQLMQVEAASSLLSDYNRRLQDELTERIRVGTMISSFLQAQRELQTQTEERLEVYRDKLDKVKQVRIDLEAHLASLPDIPSLPSDPDSLPSSENLFTG